MILVRTGECQSITTRQSKIVGMEGKIVRQSNITQYIEFEITNSLCVCIPKNWQNYSSFNSEKPCLAHAHALAHAR